LRPLLPDEESVWLFLDAAEFIDWQAMVSSDGKYKFVLDNEFVVDNGEIEQISYERNSQVQNLTFPPIWLECGGLMLRFAEWRFKLLRKNCLV
jgi:hypothetical protein